MGYEDELSTIIGSPLRLNSSFSFHLMKLQRSYEVIKITTAALNMLINNFIYGKLTVHTWLLSSYLS